MLQRLNGRGRRVVVRASAALAILQCIIAPSISVAQELRALKIDVTGGDGAINDIKNKRARNLELVIRDQNDRPLAGAVVVFQLPGNGPSGSFPDGKSSFITTTSNTGVAATVGLQPNAMEGRFNIAISASYQGLTARTSVVQTNTLAGGQISQAGGSKSKKYWILALVGGAAGGVLVVTKGGGSSTPAPTPTPGTVVTIGSISVGGPR
ncbi:MAG: hypothetical protein ABI811_06255 [Acidobacteriota bacterium]